ncbi:metal-dependent hydrolase [Xylanibacillus composti]|uniref:Inner membrane protein n=1 Tax=Xylanibacillus composti TaxID=1572762 RepID=A0A8J4H3I6_9BACL|nr:metal-dependent hydrolase [Xylanibacillus composti]MDT9727108.1 metal-dependent hydrolase [Xylanibacillus composti]GIQ68881.1 hypothetical protein XYCOK13_17050 [Xylanibacillus composti]
MDTITHTLFGLTLYGAVNKSNMNVKEKRVLLLTAVTGSQIPDIDVISAWWDTAGRYQMWHRGITHSIFLAPVWAALIAGLARLIFGVRGWIWYVTALIAVCIHNTSDLFNAWGTGYLEPFSSVRITFGTIPIVDLVFWLVMGIGFLVARYGRRWQKHHVYRAVWLLLAMHVAIQTAQGAVLHHEARQQYEQVALSADFIPGFFTVIGKREHEVEIKRGTVWKEMEEVATLTSAEGADLDTLFAENPKAKTLFEWSPFVVVEDDGKRIGIYDPRFYRNGESFLYEYFDRAD